MLVKKSIVQHLNPNLLQPKTGNIELVLDSTSMAQQSAGLLSLVDVIHIQFMCLCPRDFWTSRQITEGPVGLQLQQVRCSGRLWRTFDLSQGSRANWFPQEGKTGLGAGCVQWEWRAAYADWRYGQAVEEVLRGAKPDQHILWRGESVWVWTKRILWIQVDKMNFDSVWLG